MNSHRISCWLALTSLTLAAASFAYGTTYYVSTTGSDSNSGTSQSTPWQTLTKVDGTTFQAGDQILFLSGDVWTGQLAPKGSGANGSPIVIGNYGTGALPLIQGNGVTGGTVSLNNQTYWEITNLELTNTAGAAGNRDGISVTAGNFGLVSHIHVVGCLIHNVTGTSGQSITDKRTGGIYFGVTADNTTATRFDDILVDSCTVHDCSNEGIMTDNHIINLASPGDNTDYPNTAPWIPRRFTHVTISNNLVYNITKNAMIIRLTDNTGLVEYNVCHDTATAQTGNTIYTVSSSGTVFQHNEGYNNRTPAAVDGAFLDSDLQSPGSVWQYNFSHNNNFGLWVFEGNPQDTGMIVRYNISQNDKASSRGVIYFNYASGTSSVYNNVIYAGSSVSPIIIQSNTANHHTYSFDNNIIYNVSPSAKYSLNGGDNATYSHNIFFGNHPAGEPADPFKLTSDPLFVSPGSATFGINTNNGYQLKPGSPAIGSGLLISNNGGQDYFGNPVSATAAPNRGAYNGTGGSGGTVAAPVFSPGPGTYASTQTVSITTTTAGASIRYTTDGSTTPSETVGTLYTGPVTIATTTTLKAIAYETGMTDSSVTSGTYTITSPPPPPAAPSFSPAPGTYSGTQSVTISDTTAGASIFYTTDGSTPTTSSTLYTGPVSIATTTTLQAIANNSGGSSSVTSGTYTITAPPPPAAPSFSPPPGSYSGTQSVTISDTTAGASIFYTTDGSTPTTSSTLYTGPVSIATTTTLQAIANNSGGSSSVTSGTYTITSPPPGIEINCGGPAVSPFAADEDFTGGATIDHANTINTSKVTNPAPAAVYQSARVAATAGAGTTFSYTIGGFGAGSSNTVRLHFCETFHTTAGSRVFNVSINGTQVLTNFDIFATAGGQNIANIQEFTEAANSSGQYVIVFTSVTDKALISGIEIGATSGPQPPAAPSFSPAPGTYSSAQSVTISDTTAGASIFYTTDGSTPTTSSTAYTGPVAIATTTTLQAIANNSNGSSSVTSGTYTITTTSGPITLQASNLTPTGSGAAISTTADAAAPGGTWVKIATTAVGQWIQFTTPSIPAGTYSLSFIYRTNTTRAQHNVTIDGTQVGTTIVDQYAATATYPPAVTIGSVTFGTAGTHTIRLTATGKNAASTDFQISAVQFIFQ